MIDDIQRNFNEMQSDEQFGLPSKSPNSNFSIQLSLKKNVQQGGTPLLRALTGSMISTTQLTVIVNR